MSKSDTLGASPAFSHATTARSARAQLFDAAVGKILPGADGTLPVDAISQNPDNPRDHLRNLDDMTQSVKELGVINAITVATVDAYLRDRPGRQDELDDGTRYLVVDGHRRLEAARRAGLNTIKVTVDDQRVATDESLLEAAFVANYHRDGMTELEEAHALESLVKFYGSQTKASQRLGLAQSTISSKLSFLKLSPELQADLAQGRRKSEHVRNLGKLSPEEQRAEASARAEAAREKAQQEHAPGPVPQQAPATVEESNANYHGVIIPTDEPAEVSAAPPEPRDTVPEPRSRPVQAAPPAEPAESEGQLRGSETVELPVGDVEALGDALIDLLSDSDRVRLTMRLIDYNTEVKGHAQGSA